jgi:hypothetical protein
VKKPYQISKADAKASAVLQRFTQANGQFLLPLVELITDARLAVDTVIDQIGRQTIETILLLSAQEVAGTRTPGKPSGEVRWHGSQPGRVMLADRAVRVNRPRLRPTLKLGNSVTLTRPTRNSHKLLQNPNKNRPLQPARLP